MQLPEMRQADRLLFHAETLLDFLATFAALQGSAVTLLQGALNDNEVHVTLPDVRPELATLANDLRKVLLALHREATK